jgi:hypothetical protein
VSDTYLTDLENPREPDSDIEPEMGHMVIKVSLIMIEEFICGRLKPFITDLPKDLNIESIYTVTGEGIAYVKVKHPSFPVIELGELIPELDVVVTTKEKIIEGSTQENPNS